MLSTLRRLASKFFKLAKREISVIEELHSEVRATIDRLEAKDPGLKQLLEQAYGYAVFPAVGKASAVIGGAFGKGEVFRNGKLIGYAAVAQLTIGVQLGGQTFSEIIAFQNKAALDQFRAGRYAFAANASVVLVKAGAAATTDYQGGVAVLVHADGGMMLELAIGGQKFFFAPAALGRGKKSGTPKKDAKPASSKAKPPSTAKATTQAAKSSRRTPGSKPGGIPKARSSPRPGGGTRAASATRRADVQANSRRPRRKPSARGAAGAGSRPARR